tara:strand:+ start:388 stop:939 length:552 start_codon:yes stop_codon:yes gene_type:complete
MNEYELALKEYMDRLKGGFGGAMTGVMDGLGGGSPLEGKIKENNFLKSLMGGNLEVNDANTQKVFDSLDPVNMRSMVSTNNASGTDPMMMAGANAVGAGLTDVAQPVVNSIGFPDSRGFDTPANRDNYNLRRIQQLESMMTADEANVYNQLEDFQKDAFLQAIEENKISQYEAENFDRLRMPY